MKTDYRVAIVGGGPAGSSLANTLMLSGARGIALIDRETFPRDKCCGDGLGAGVIEVLEQLQLGHILDGRRRLRIMETNFHDKIHVTIDTDLHDRPSPLGYVIARSEFDDLLVKAAFARGADDLTGWALKSATWSGDHWVLELKGADGAMRSLSADILVGADGARSKTRQVFGQGYGSAAQNGVAVRAYVDVIPAEKGYQRIDILPGLPNPGYAWIFSDGMGRANMGLGFLASSWKRSNEHFPDLLERYCQHLGPMLQGPPEKIRTAILPFGSARPPLAYPDRNGALIGDAASMVNPSIGEGIFYAMYAGLILGRQLSHALKHSASVRQALQAYQREFNRDFAPAYRNAWIMMKLVSRQKLLENLVGNIDASADFSYDFADFIMGVMPPRKPKSLPGLVLSGMTPKWLRFSH